MLLKILTIVGARPQFVKAAAVSRALESLSHNINQVLVHTGQHFDSNMSDVFFKELQLSKPDYSLGISNKSHGEMTGEMLKKIEEIVLIEKPHFVLVFGDTNSTLAGALAASKIHVPIAHVEAGLRSFNMTMPEEINRILTDRVSTLLFCPTETAVQNLLNEGFPFNYQTIQNVGDVMYDAVLYYQEVAKEKMASLSGLNLSPDQYCLATFHRAENTDNTENLKEIVNGLNRLNELISVVVPIHPRTKNRIIELDIAVKFKVIEPIGYLEMLTLISNSRLVLTDSGGLQKEAFFLNKYCITMREETEWVELLEGGYNFLVGAKADSIIEAFKILEGKKFNKQHNFYGKGDASQKIVDAIYEYIK